MLEELIEYLNKQIEDERNFYVEGCKGVITVNDWELAKSAGRYEAFKQVLKFVKSFEEFEDW